MSKAALRKELVKMSQEQLVTLILDLYSARPQAKEYFEFFLNPDEKELYAKYIKIVEKEVYRSKRGMLCARVSYLNAYIKDFASFGVSASAVIDLTLHIARIILILERAYYMTDALHNSGGKFIVAALTRANDAGLFKETMQCIENLLAMPQVRPGYAREIKEQIADYLMEAQK